MRILCDVDGVLADTTGEFLEGLKILAGKAFDPADVGEWDYQKALNISAEEEHVGWSWVHTETTPEVEGSVAAIQRLAQRHRVVFVTAPHSHISDWTFGRERWLKKRFGNLPIIHTTNKELIPGSVLIDDKPENIGAWQNAHGGLGILFAQPWNLGAALGANTCRTRDWGVIERLLNSVETRAESTRIAEMRCP